MSCLFYFIEVLQKINECIFWCQFFVGVFLNTPTCFLLLWLQLYQSCIWCRKIKKLLKNKSSYICICTCEEQKIRAEQGPVPQNLGVYDANQLNIASPINIHDNGSSLKSRLGNALKISTKCGKRLHVDIWNKFIIMVKGLCPFWKPLKLLSWGSPANWRATGIDVLRDS